jgi:hypothetical protein
MNCQSKDKSQPQWRMPPKVRHYLWVFLSEKEKSSISFKTQCVNTCITHSFELISK